MSETPMSLIQHLEELRKIIIRIIIAIVIGTIVSFALFEQTLMEIINAPVYREGIYLHQLGMTEVFITQIKVSFLSGLVITIPFTAYQVWSFILPALYAHERKYVYMIVPATILLFAAGVVFGYYVVLPIAITFLTTRLPEVVELLSFAQYVSFVVSLLIPFGFVFQLPLAIAFLARIGVVNYKFFQEKRKYAILIIFIVSALLTPPDPLSLILMAIPVMILYEFSILIAWLIGKKVKKEEVDEAEDFEEVTETKEEGEDKDDIS